MILRIFILSRINFCLNQSIRVGNTFLMHKHWIDEGVYCVAHFLNEEVKILFHIDF